jgi:hypothetical protein
MNLHKTPKPGKPLAGMCEPDEEGLFSDVNAQHGAAIAGGGWSGQCELTHQSGPIRGPGASPLYGSRGPPADWQSQKDQSTGGAPGTFKWRSLLGRSQDLRPWTRKWKKRNAGSRAIPGRITFFLKFP